MRMSAIRRAWLDALIDDLAALRAAGRQVVWFLRRDRRRPAGFGPDRPGSAARGKTGGGGDRQIRLAHAYQETWHRHGVTVAQIPLSIDDTEGAPPAFNARATIQQLLDLGAGAGDQ